MPAQFKDVTQQISEVAASYQYHNPPTILLQLQELISILLRMLRDFLESLHIFAPQMSDTRMASDIMQFLLYGTGAVCAVILLFVVWSRLNRLTQQSKLARAGALASSGSLDAEGWLKEGRSLAERGQFRESCRAIYFSLLKLLDEKEIYSFAPTRTNYEYWYGLVGNKRIQRLFRELADTVELVWFGNKEADAADFEQCLALLNDATAEIETVAPQKDSTGGSAAGGGAPPLASGGGGKQ